MSSGSRDRRGNQVAEAAPGLDDIDAKLAAQPANQYFDGVGILGVGGAMDVLAELELRHDATALMDQIGDDAIFQRRQVDRNAAHADFHLTFVESEIANGHYRRSSTGRSAQDRSQPRQQFFHLERLWQIIVGAGIDTIDALAPAPAR